MNEGAIEVLYEPPRSSTRARVASAAFAAVFLALVGWVLARLLRGPVSAALALAVTVAVLFAQKRFGEKGIRATLGVTADRAARELTWRYRGGSVVIPFDEITEVAAGEVTAVDGVSLAAVTLTRRQGEPLRFAVHGDAAAKGIVDALTALRGGRVPEP